MAAIHIASRVFSSGVVLFKSPHQNCFSIALGLLVLVALSPQIRADIVCFDMPSESTDANVFEFSNTIDDELPANQNNALAHVFDLGDRSGSLVLSSRGSSDFELNFNSVESTIATVQPSSMFQSFRIKHQPFSVASVESKAVRSGSQILMNSQPTNRKDKNSVGVLKVSSKFLSVGQSECMQSKTCVLQSNAGCKKH